MAILLIRNDKNYQPWINALKACDPFIPVYTPNETPNKDEIVMILCWKAPAGSFKPYKNVKVIGSMGAGVDHLFDDPDLPSDAILTRVVDNKLSGDMQEFVLALCLNYMKNLNIYSQRSPSWNPLPYQRIEDIHVGILGLGTLGQAVGKQLHDIGFRVSGWSKSKKNIDGITSYNEANLASFLPLCNIMVCLLPLTPQTRGFLNASLFDQLPKGAYLINVARGGHVNENDLIDAINQGKLAGAALDVFSQEPLPGDHPIRSCERILITPHVASVSSPSSVAQQVIDNYHSLKQQQHLRHQVSREKRY